MNHKKLEIPQLPITRLRFTYGTDNMPRLPAFMGSTWRGAFGHALKATVCLTAMDQCKACPVKEDCAYVYLFETPPPENSEKMRKYPSAPHPFVFAETQQKTMKIGERFSLAVIVNLIGRAIAYLPLIVSVMQRMGESGLGKKKQVFALNLTEFEPKFGINEWQPLQLKSHSMPKPQAIKIPSVPDSVRLTFTSPLRLMQDNRLIKPGQLKFVNFFSTLLRRVSMLSYFHTSTALETDFMGLVAQAEEVKLKNPALKWKDWERHSSRQQRHVQMGGIVGEFTLHGKALKGFWSYIWLGQWTHVGKGAVMGMGKYKVNTIYEGKQCEKKPNDGI